MRSFVLNSMLAGLAAAAAGPYAQCGGSGWSGDTACVSGYSCTVSNEYYSQCLPGTAATTTLATSTLTTTATSAPTSAAGKFKWLGINLSVAEFGSTTYPGTWGKDFYFPDNTAISVRNRTQVTAFDGHILTTCYRLSGARDIIYSAWLSLWSVSCPTSSPTQPLLPT